MTRFTSVESCTCPGLQNPAGSSQTVEPGLAIPSRGALLPPPPHFCIRCLQLTAEGLDSYLDLRELSKQSGALPASLLQTSWLVSGSALCPPQLRRVTGLSWGQLGGARGRQWVQSLGQLGRAQGGQWAQTWGQLGQVPSGQ